MELVNRHTYCPESLVIAMDIDTVLVAVKLTVLVTTREVAISDPLWYQLAPGAGNPSEEQLIVVFPPNVTSVVPDRLIILGATAIQKHAILECKMMR